MKTGDKLSGLVTGIQPYGIFVSLENETVGLIHISELKTGYVDNIYDVVSVGQEVQVQVIDVDEYTGKTSLSLRSLEEEKHHFPRKRRFSSDRNPSGFMPIKRAMPGWITESLEQLQENKTS